MTMETLPTGRVSWVILTRSYIIHMQRYNMICYETLYNLCIGKLHYLYLQCMHHVGICAYA